MVLIYLPGAIRQDCSDRSREIGTQHFHCDVAAVFHVPRQIHRRHASDADNFLKLVAAGEGGFQVVWDVKHD